MKTPIYLKPAKYIIPIKLIRYFEKHALDLSTRKITFKNNSMSSLKRELRWLLEDSISEISYLKDDKLEWQPFENHINLNNQQNNTYLKTRINLNQLNQLWQQRITEQVPIQYILGSVHWRDLILNVGPGVLIPRPETELIIDIVEDYINKIYNKKPQIWVDLGTGSGAIAIALSYILPENSLIYGIDISEEALEYAKMNVKKYGLEDKIRLIKGNWLNPLKKLNIKIDGIVTNPPYIPTDEILSLQAEVRKHEPHLALDGGKGGLDEFKRILNDVRCLNLNTKHMIILEINGNHLQAKYLKSYLSILTLTSPVTVEKNELKSQQLFNHSRTCHNTHIFKEDNVKIIKDFAGLNRFFVYESSSLENL